MGESPARTIEALYLTYLCAFDRGDNNKSIFHEPTLAMEKLYNRVIKLADIIANKHGCGPEWQEIRDGQIYIRQASEWVGEVHIMAMIDPYLLFSMHQKRELEYQKALY